MCHLATWIMGTFFRWFPHRAPTGLSVVGKPDESSPVLVSCNCTLSVARLLRELKGLDVWVLVASSGGINVWCAACGGEFTDHQVISAIKTSLLSEKVNHRRIILPALSAPGMNLQRIHEQTGFAARFGPVRAVDIRAYLDTSLNKTEQMCRVRYGLPHRLDMLLAINFIYWAPVAALFAIFWPNALLHLSALFWGTAFVAYVGFPWIPGRRGWTKAVVLMAALAVGYLGAGHLLHSNPLFYWPWMIGAALLTSLIGFDLAGTAAPVPSDAEELMHRLGIKGVGPLMKEKTLGRVALDQDACRGCLSCHEICPLGVFDPDREARKTNAIRAADCFSCGACVKQCPEQALSLTSS